jgi:hypothetical protein
MDDDRNQGVTEARFALTLVICGLVAIGYVVLLRLSGGPSHSTIEIRPDVVVQPTAPREDENLPRVLPVDVPGSGGQRPHEVATRPDFAPSDDSKSGPTGPIPTGDAQRR